ncbi:hypothetical protein ACHQM5_002258 [Ranunculus cassubicifolius]
MDTGSWWNLGRRSVRLGRSKRYMDIKYDEFAASPSKTPVWRMLWRKLKKEKKKVFYGSTPFPTPYDPYTYSQNFDQGTAWTEPDNLTRSFSARYADSSRVFQRNGSVSW